MVGNDIACDNLIRHFRRLGLNVDVTNVDGYTPLLLAAKGGNITCAQILVGQGKASLSYRDRKYGLSVEEWLSKKGLSVKDITPVRNDGRGRSRFVKAANVAAACAAPRKVAPKDDYRYQHFRQEGIRLEKYDNHDDDYTSDATTMSACTTEEGRYMERRYSDSPQIMRRHSNSKKIQHTPIVRETSKPKMKTQETQTMPVLIAHDLDDDELDDETVANTEYTVLKDNVQLEKRKPVKSMHKTLMMSRTSSKKRFSLPETLSMDTIDTAKNSLDASILPEKLIATIDLGDGRRQSIQIHPDSFKNKVYWTPYPDDDGAETVNTLLFDPPEKSEDGSLCSTNDEPVFA